MIDLGALTLDPQGIGVVGLCLLAVSAFLRGWVVTGRELAEVSKQRDEWREIALRSLNVSERTTGASEVAADALAALPRVLDDKP